MSEEEKKAIEELKSFINDKDCVYWIGKNGEEAVKIILNLIEKQQKEIERLEARKYMFNAETGEISQIPLNNNYINKDKIREKIEDLEKQDKESKLSHNYLIIPVLHSLLEEE